MAILFCMRFLAFYVIYWFVELKCKYVLIINLIPDLYALFDIYKQICMNWRNIHIFFNKKLLLINQKSWHTLL